MYALKLNKLSSNPFFTIYYEVTWLSTILYFSMYQMRTIPHKIAMNIKGDNAYKLRAQYLEYGLTH